MKKPVKIFLILILFLFLFLIRAFEAELFYDPLIVYFQNDYLYKSIPNIDEWKLVIDMLWRYVINSLISLGIIALIFKKKEYIKFSGFFLMLAFMLLIIVFSFLLKDGFKSGYLFPFYIRRFIIHPIFLFLLLPAFYYQKLKKKT